MKVQNYHPVFSREVSREAFTKVLRDYYREIDGIQNLLLGGGGIVLFSAQGVLKYTSGMHTHRKCTENKH